MYNCCGILCGYGKLGLECAAIMTQEVPINYVFVGRTISSLLYGGAKQDIVPFVNGRFDGH